MALDAAVLKQAYDRLTGVHGLPPRVAVGILGQLTAESGGNLNTGARGDPNLPGGSYGIAQWNRERLAGLQKFQSAYGAQDDLSKQIDYLVHELKSVEKPALDRMMGATSADAMTAAAVGFERPEGYSLANPRGAHRYGTRLDYTQQIPGLLGLTGTAAAPTQDATVQQAVQAGNIDQFRQMLEAKYPGIRFTSGYRDPGQNKAAGGAKGSQHLHNRAVDVGLKEYSPEQQREIIEYARSIGARGLGYYPNSQSAHFDIRTGAPAAWGPNYSRTSLGKTPDFFQQIAKSHLSGAPASSATTQVAGGGDFWSGGGGPGGVIATADTPPSPIAAPNLPPVMDAGQAFAAEMAKDDKPQQVAAAPPAPIISAPQQQTAMVNQPDQGSAANLMASLLEKRRQPWASAAPRGFL